MIPGVDCIIILFASCEGKGTNGAKSDLEYTVKNNPITRIMTDRKHIATIPESIGDYNYTRETIIINVTRSFRHHTAIFLNIFAMYTPVASIAL